MSGGTDDYQLRFRVADPGYSEEDNRIYDQAMAAIEKAIAAKTAWNKVVDGLTMVADEGFRNVILDDYVKITLATRHFQNSEGLKNIAKATGIPMDLLVRSKQEMIREVEEASVAAYHLTQGGEGDTKSH
ncbi:MAG: hypothetical protein HQL89_17595 [Magnetococcales bacterium]|nr:hypothetical protein [Magnetococcales bacterium]